MRFRLSACVSWTWAGAEFIVDGVRRAAPGDGAADPNLQDMQQKTLLTVLLLLLFGGLALAQERSSGLIEYADGQKVQLGPSSRAQVCDFLMTFLKSGKDGTARVIEPTAEGLVMVRKGGEVTIFENKKTGTMGIDEALRLLTMSQAEEIFGVCISNVRNLGLATESWAQDHEGHYPESLARLVPKYLEAVPVCPASETDTYSATYRKGLEPDWFQVQCSGDHGAAEVARGLPAYISTQDVILDLSSLERYLKPEPLQDGFYRVLRTFESSAAMDKELGPGERMLRYNPIFVEGENKEEVVIVRAEPFVPMLLQEPPSKIADRTERTQFWLGVSLTPEAADSFEQFTRDNLGERLAIVAGGDVITMHGIKSVISGGKVQISRCGDRGCEVLFRELNDNIR